MGKNRSVMSLLVVLIVSRKYISNKSNEGIKMLSCKFTENKHWKSQHNVDCAKCSLLLLSLSKYTTSPHCFWVNICSKYTTSPHCFWVNICHSPPHCFWVNICSKYTTSPHCFWVNICHSPPHCFWVNICHSPVFIFDVDYGFFSSGLHSSWDKKFPKRQFINKQKSVPAIGETSFFQILHTDL